jgi:hypothetical protein
MTWTIQTTVCLSPALALLWDRLPDVQSLTTPNGANSGWLSCADVSVLDQGCAILKPLVIAIVSGLVFQLLLVLVVFPRPRALSLSIKVKTNQIIQRPIWTQTDIHRHGAPGSMISLATS